MPNDVEEFFKTPQKTRSRKKVVEEKKLVEAEIEKSNNLIKKAVYFFIILILLGLIGTSVYFYRQYRKAVASPSAAAQDEIKAITDKIGSFMELPLDTPTLATVLDKEKLQGQAFFANAQNGDKVLIYSKTQKAILWRPTTAKVIEVASLSMGSQDANIANTQNQKTPEQATSANQDSATAQTQKQTEVAAPDKQTSTQTEKVNVAIYNGTNTKGLAATLAEKISAVGNIQVIKKANATGTYVNTTVIDLSGKNLQKAQEIADTVSGEVGDLPSGETRPDADILVIGGGK